MALKYLTTTILLTELLFVIAEYIPEIFIDEMMSKLKKNFINFFHVISLRISIFY